MKPGFPQPVAVGAVEVRGWFVGIAYERRSPFLDFRCLILLLFDKGTNLTLDLHSCIERYFNAVGR